MSCDVQLAPGMVIRTFWDRSRPAGYKGKGGCQGFHSYVVLSIGHKWITMLYPPSCTLVKVRRSNMEFLTPIDSPGTADYLEQRLADRRARGKTVARADTLKAINLIREQNAK